MSDISVEARPADAAQAATNLSVKIFADGANLADIEALYRNPLIRGFTTNPTLMKKAGVRDYAAFARDVLAINPDRPVSFEVFSDDFREMARQAETIARWGENVYVKIPITNTRGDSACGLIAALAASGVKVNVTAILTIRQVEDATAAVTGGAPSCLSVFAGRIADTGRDPVPMLVESLAIMRNAPRAELVWASPRELLNVFQADAIGCHIITVTADILNKLALIGKRLEEHSLDTVKMFRTDAVTAGFEL